MNDVSLKLAHKQKPHVGGKMTRLAQTLLESIVRSCYFEIFEITRNGIEEKVIILWEAVRIG